MFGNPDQCFPPLGRQYLRVCRRRLRGLLDGALEVMSVIASKRRALVVRLAQVLFDLDEVELSVLRQRS